MKKLTIMILILVLILPCMTSCGYIKLNYPKEMTNEYCLQNYCFADPNLVFLSCDMNDVDGYSYLRATTFQFKAIKGISPEEYLVVRNNTIFDKNTFYCVIKNRSLDLEDSEILTKEIESIEIYKRRVVSDKDRYMCKFGKICYDEQIALLTEEQTDAFINQVKTALETSTDQEFWTTRNDLARMWQLQEGTYIRVHFSEYENLVWDSYISYREGKYHIVFYRYDPAYLSSEESKKDLSYQVDHSGWIGLSIELPEEVSDLIPES